MSDDKNETWLSYLALATVILVVCATLATFKWGANPTSSVMHQSQPSDQWAHYQAKSIKSYLYQMQIEKLELELHGYARSGAKATVDEYKLRVADYRKRVETCLRKGVMSQYCSVRMILHISSFLTPVTAQAIAARNWFVRFAL